MIKTTEPKSYRPSYPELTAVIYSDTVGLSIDDKAEGATYIFNEWVEIPYQKEVPNENNEMELQDFVKIEYIRQGVPKFIPFAESNALKSYVDQNYTTDLVGDFKEKWYRELGHLIMKNFEEAYSATWIPV